MAWFKKAVDVFAVCFLFPIVLLLLGGIAIAVGVQALLIWVGALLAAWLFTAFGFPLVTGAMTLDEIADGFRSQRRSERLYEGEPLRHRRLRFPNLRRAMKRAEIVDDFTPRRRSARPYERQSLPTRTKKRSDPE